MSNNKQGSIEWLQLALEKLWVEKYLSPITIKPLLEQAKVMHKEEIEKAYNESFRLRDKPYSTAIKYYNETFGDNNEQQ
jgi:hypothetical protein